MHRSAASLRTTASRKWCKKSVGNQGNVHIRDLMFHGDGSKGVYQPGPVQVVYVIILSVPAPHHPGPRSSLPLFIIYLATTEEMIRWVYMMSFNFRSVHALAGRVRCYSDLGILTLFFQYRFRHQSTLLKGIGVSPPAPIS